MEARVVVPALGVARWAVVSAAEVLILVAAVRTDRLPSCAKDGRSGAHTARWAQGLVECAYW